MATNLGLLNNKLYAKYLGCTLSFGIIAFICWLNAYSPSEAIPIFPILPIQVIKIEFLPTILAFFLAFSDIYSFESTISLMPSSAIISGFIKQISSELQNASVFLLGVLPVIISPSSFIITSIYITPTNPNCSISSSF